jgi:hypothetical protein
MFNFLFLIMKGKKKAVAGGWRVRRKQFWMFPAVAAQRRSG